MNKFENILSGVLEEISQPSSVTLNPKQLANDFKKMASVATPATQAAINAMAEPMETSTEKDPNEDLMKKLEELDFEKLPTEKKEQFIKTLMSLGIPLKNQDENQSEDKAETTSTDNVKPTIKTTNPASYGV